MSWLTCPSMQAMTPSGSSTRNASLARALRLVRAAPVAKAGPAALLTRTSAPLAQGPGEAKPSSSSSLPGLGSSSACMRVRTCNSRPMLQQLPCLM